MKTKHGSLWNDDRGSALIEFVVLGLVAQLLVLGVGVGLVAHQQAQLAAVSAAKLFGRSLSAGSAMSANPLELERQIAASFGVPVEAVTLSSIRTGDYIQVSAEVGDSRFSYLVRSQR